MSNRKRYIFFLFVFLLLSCEDLVEIDITEEHIVLKTPRDGYSSSVQSQTFWWEELKGATQYKLTIVSPGIVNPDVLILDTLITKNKFTWSLEAGEYGWCVKGINGSYQTYDTCRTLEITN